MLELDDVRVHYGATLAIDGIDLAVEPGTIVSVLGPSGSGKSTLLRAVAGLEPLTSGRVAWDGVDLRDVPVHRRGFGLMFQDHALFPHRDVLGNVAFGLRMRGDTDVDTRCREVLAMTGLAGYEHRRVFELSGGEQQRVALARALAPRPRVLMLDEPLGSLDRVLRERLVRELRALFRDLGITVLAVTHDHEEAFALADRVLVLRAGRVEDDGPAERVWNHPRTPFAATFLGFDTTTTAAVAAGTAASAWGDLPAPGIPDGPALVAARATAFSIAADGRIEGAVADHEFRRDRFLVRVDTASGPLRVAVGAGDVPPVGAPVHLRLHPDGMVLFPLL
ncbi:MAG: ABC transporter ATP-binding protein [Acidimicrobiia bacterium]